jgi:uncharacterized membrane protein
VRRTGERAFQALFSLLSFTGIGWLIWAYSMTDRAASGAPPSAVTFLAIMLSMAGLWLAIIGVFSPNPTSLGQESLLRSANPARGIIRITRHPFMAGFAIWALAHMLLNPEAASLVFFGTFFVLAGLGPWLIDAKKARTLGEHWPAFASATSILPFAAIIQGRNRFVSSEIGWWRPLVALLAVGLLVYFHGNLFGVKML